MTTTTTTADERRLGSAGAPRTILPFELELAPVDRMVNLELADDPHYTGLEIQAFDDPIHGTGMLVFLQRRDDGRVDVYLQPGLRVDREGYGIGAGLGRWEETEIAPDRLDLTPFGAVVDVRLRDAAGRPIAIRLDDRSRRPRRPASFLAPFGAGIEHPRSLLLVWMRRFDLLRDRGPLEVRIDGRRATIGKLPGARLHRRRLVKSASNLVAVSLNRAGERAAIVVDLSAPGDVEPGPGQTGIAAVRRTVAGHRARLALTPALPDLEALPDGRRSEGRWELSIDGSPRVVGGTWVAERRGPAVDLCMDVARGWRPRGLPPLMRFVTRVAPVFRTWPTTYRWLATLSLGNEPRIASRWERTGEERGETYRRLTGSA